MSNQKNQQVQRNQQKTEYNLIYEKLESDGLIGKIAYCFYKESKRTFICDYIQKHNGKYPSNAEIKKFVSLQESQHIDHFKRDAIEMVNEFYNELLEEQKKDLKIQILREVNKPKFWSGIGQNLFASLIWTILIAIFLPFIIRAANIDIVNILRGNKQDVKSITSDSTSNSINKKIE